MSLLAGIVVVAFGAFLIGLTGVVFAKPALAERFFMSFVSSARAHYAEQAFRLLIGASLVVLSPAMWQATMFRVIGWMIVVTSVGLILIPWRWHHRFGDWGAPDGRSAYESVRDGAIRIRRSSTLRRFLCWFLG